MTAPSKPNSGMALRRGLKIVSCLVGRVFDGLSLGELAKTIDENEVYTYRALQVLQEEGWVKKLDNGCWSLTLRPLQLLQAYHNHSDATQHRLNEMNHNIINGARRFA